MKKISPKEYQQRILDSIELLPSVALFMGTGSGKTYTSLFKAKANGTKQLLILTPRKVVVQWEKSIKDVFPELEVIAPKKSHSAAKFSSLLDELDNDSNKAIIAPLSILDKLHILPRLINEEYTIIVDESHKIKEIGTARKPVVTTRAVLRYKDLTPYKIILTATPTQKMYGGYIDYYTQLMFLGYMKMPIRAFKDKYCKTEKVNVGLPYAIEKIVGYKNVDELDKILKFCSVRYTVKRYDDEPRHIKVELDKPSNYNKTSRENAYEDIALDNISKKRNVLKYVTGGLIRSNNINDDIVTYKDNTIKASWLEEFLSNTDEVISIFYCYNVERDVIVDVCKKLGKTYGVINGDVAQDKKYSMINDEEYDVYIGQIAAMGESLDGLQFKCHISVFYSMPESSLQYIQGLGRIDREGQEYLPTYYSLVCKGTLDAIIQKLIEDKVEFSESVLDKLLLEEEK